MKTGQFHSFRPFVLSIGVVLLTAASQIKAGTVTVTETTDWSKTPMELIGANFPTLGYSGPVYAGLNTVSVNNGGSTATYYGFCVDPFHWSSSGPTPGYSIVPLGAAPKLPGTLNTYTALEIEDLWAQFFSPTMTAPAAAGLQIAIWELVSSNAVASGQLSSKDAVSFYGNTYTAASDIASLATYHGPPASLVGLSGPGQDYIISIPNNNALTPSQVPDGGGTFVMLTLTLVALVSAQRVTFEADKKQPKLQVVPIRRR